MNEALPKKLVADQTSHEESIIEAVDEKWPCLFVDLSVHTSAQQVALVDALVERYNAHAKLQERIDELEEENAEYLLVHNLTVDEVNDGVSDRVERTADIHALMDKMALLMEGVAEGWSDGLDNKGSAAFFAVEQAQQVYTRCAARYGMPEVSRSCESGEGEAEDDETGPRSDLPECKMPPAMLQAMINNAVHLPISLLPPEEATTPTIRSIPVVIDASIPEGGPQVIVRGCPFDEEVKG